MKICVLAANPSETERINLEQELGQIRDAVGRGAMRDRLTIRQVPRCRVSELQHILDTERPDVVHFSGHGTESYGEIVLYDDHDRSIPVQIDALANMLSETTGVVLNSCASEHQAKLVAAKGPWAIGMSGRLPNADACSFSHAFYGRLADGRTVVEAFKGAKDRLGAEHRSSASMLVFFAGRDPPTPAAERRMPWTARTRRFLARPAVMVVSALALIPAALIVGRAMHASEIIERAATHRDNGWQAMKRLDTQEAAAQLELAVALDPEASIGRAALAVAFAERGDYVRAKPESEAALAHMRSLEPREQLWLRGVAAEMRWELPTAIAFYRDGWHTHRDREAGLRMAHVQTLSGATAAANATLDELARTPDYDDARVDFEQAEASRDSPLDDQRTVLRDIRARHTQHPRVLAATLWMECDALANQDDKRDEAVAVCAEASKQFAGSSPTEDALGRARIKSIQARLLAAGFGLDSRADRRSQALESAREAVAIARDQRSQIDEAGALLNLAVVEETLAQVANDLASSGKPSVYVRDAIAIYDRIGHVSGAQQLAFNLALGWEDKCQTRRARDELAAVLVKLGERNLDYEKLKVAARLGRLQFFLGDLAKAQDNLELAARLMFERDARVDDAANVLLDLAELYLARGDAARAWRCLEGKDCYAERPERTRSVAKNSSTHAALLMESGCPPQAEQAARAAMEGANDFPEEYQAARGVLVRALVARGGNAGSSTRPDLTTELTSIASEPDPTDELCRPRIHRLISRARALGFLGKLVDAQSDLERALRATQDHGLVALELEALLARVEIEHKTPHASDAQNDAQRVRTRADQVGFVQIRNRLDALGRAPKPCDPTR